MAAAGLARLSSSSTARKFVSERLGLEADLADRDVDVAVAIGAVLDPAALELGDGPADVGGDRAGLRVGHQATGTEHPAEAADQGHEVGRGDGHVEVEHAALDLLGQVVGADDVGTGGPGLGGGLAGGEHGAPGRPCRCPTAGATVPRTIWSALRGSTPRRTTSSTVSSKLALARLFTRSNASVGGELLVPVEPLGGVDVLLALRHVMAPSWCRAGRARSSRSRRWVVVVLVRVGVS